MTGIDTIIHDDPIQQSRNLAVTIADILADTPASDTQVIDIHELTHIADLFVICSGDNERQLRAILRLVSENLKEQGIDPVRIEGEPASGWVLMDFRDVIVHVFDKDIRTFYNLEERWAEAPVVLAIQ
ncbi:MAG TPA: ribosome silencing factor [Thermomicrobiales bacterium]|nr:ribosome silencing factor [Thermomicrobiales bacterium]